MTAPPRRRLFLVDGYALIFRAFFALGDQRQLLNSKGENTAIARGALDFLRRLIDKHKPEFLGWVHDAGLSFRHEQYPEYKATREKLEPELQADFDTGVERVKELLAGYRVPILSVEGYEADDVIGTLALQAAAAGVEAVIVSGDKDFVQMVRPGVSILNPWHGRPGHTTEKWYDESNATERLGIPPNRVVDYLALLGDSSDNVPGVKGIGDKTALALIERWGALEEILGHVNEVEPKRARTALQEHGASGVLSKGLVTIRTDLNIRLDLESALVREPDWKTLRDLFIRLEFRTHAQDAASRADGSAGTTLVESTAVPEVPARTYETITNLAALERLIARARTAKAIAIDTETVLDAGAPDVVNPMRAKLVGISIATAPDLAFYLPFRHQSPGGDQSSLLIGEEPKIDLPANLPPISSKELKPLRDLLADPSVAKTGHNIKYDLLVLKREGILLSGVNFDSMLASYLLDPGRRSHALDALSIEFLQRPMTEYTDLVGKGKAQIGFDRVTVAAATQYAAADADVALALQKIFAPKLAETLAARLLQDVELPLLHVLADMESTGVCIDLPWFRSLKERFARDRAASEEAIYAAAGERFNVNSNKQLASILFERMGLPVRKKTATGPSTDASVLQQLADEGHALPGLIMEYREFAKLENTYLDTLPTLVNPETGRLHTSYSQTVAATGRLSSHDPNLQNIPIRRELGKAIRQGFVPREGWEFLTADYSQIELRILAHVSGDPAFVEAFTVGGDIHRQTASIIFGVDTTDVTSEMRSRAKTINFGTIYGQGAHSLSRQLRIDHAAAKEFIETYFRRFAGVRAFLDGSVVGARERGYVETILGRRRFIPEINDRNFNIRAFGERLAQNSPIQGSAADLIKVAMINVHRDLVSAGLRSRMLLQVHDELVFECPPQEVEQLRDLVARAMTSAVSLKVPLVVDIGVGKNWLEAKS